MVVADADRLDIGSHVNEPTEEERHTLRRVPGSIPWIAYALCLVEFAERASYYGVQPLIGNFVNRKLPPGGNGFGAPPKGSQATAGALGMGTVKASAVAQSFNMLVTLVTGFLASSCTTATAGEAMRAGCNARGACTGFHMLSMTTSMPVSLSCWT